MTGIGGDIATIPGSMNRETRAATHREHVAGVDAANMEGGAAGRAADAWSAVPCAF